MANVNDIEECRSQCTIQSRYNCRSFNFNAFRKECFLSSDDSISLPSGLQQDRDFTFSERGGCNSGTGYNDGIKGEEREKNNLTNITTFNTEYLDKQLTRHFVKSLAFTFLHFCCFLFAVINIF